GMMMSPAVFDDEGQDVAPTGGSGAFRMTEYVSGDHITFTAVDDYWDPDQLCIAELYMRIAGDDQARFNSVVTGTSDATFLRTNMVQDAERLAAEDDFHVVYGPAISLYLMNMNSSAPPFDDLRVRQAINHAIDR